MFKTGLYECRHNFAISLIVLLFSNDLCHKAYYYLKEVFMTKRISQSEKNTAEGHQNLGSELEKINIYKV